MNEYEKLLDNAVKDDVAVIEKYPFKSDSFKGLYCDGVIALGKNIDTEAEKVCILAEELGHHYTAAGDRHYRPISHGKPQAGNARQNDCLQQINRSARYSGCLSAPLPRTS